MFSNFLKFVGNSSDNEVLSLEDFLHNYEGRVFLNGLYRLHKLTDVEKWTDIIKKSYPKFNGDIKIFGYDWLGRNFALDLNRNVVLIFEPGTGEILNTQVDFFDFHNNEIIESHEACLASNFFEAWCKATGDVTLSYDKCVGYKIPLFLNGKDEIENLEVSDMEVYWEIMMPLMNF